MGTGQICPKTLLPSKKIIIIIKIENWLARGKSFCNKIIRISLIIIINKGINKKKEN